MKAAGDSFAAGFRHRLNRVTEPQFLFPMIAVMALAAIWTVTANVIRAERAATVSAATLSARELAETYEAQVVRALREIDQTLKVVKYAYERRGRQAVLKDLKAKSLLPPDLLFTVSIADASGDVVASTRPPPFTNVVDRNFFRDQRESDAIQVGRPRENATAGEWILPFSRRLAAPDGGFAGVVIVSVDATFFVSGYETSKLGGHGMIGLIGTDGIFRARRSGETMTGDDIASYPVLVPGVDQRENEVGLLTNPWDGVRRFTTAQRLFEFPFAVVVGLSEEEQLAATKSRKRVYLWRAAGASLLLLLIALALGRMSRELALIRARAIAEHIAHAERAEFLAYHDSLTTLPNRSLFSKLLGQSIAQSKRYDRKLAVLFLDLDRFKHINDTLGHEAGDQLLQEVATRLKTCLRDTDTVARLGGDEFVALLPELTEETRVAVVAQKILSAVSAPYVLAGQDFRITASVGISIYPRDGLDEQTLTKNADTAMYRAKEDGRNKFQMFSASLNAESLERLTLESSLRHALERGEFELYYQAKQDIRSGAVTGMEALLRWQHPTLGTVAPMKFIPVAEETGLILPIGKWVLRTACLQNMAWQKAGLPHLGMAVNLTERQFFDDNLLADLTAVLADTRMDARLLELEITESLLMGDMHKSVRILTGIRDLGVRIAIDNFGVGYSSLSSLKNLPLDTIKIDGSFIHEVNGAVANRELAKAILAVGRTLSLNVVAQGVETKAQADFLRQNITGEFQGFYLNKPMPADQIAALLLTQAA